MQPSRAPDFRRLLFYARTRQSSSINISWGSEPPVRIRKQCLPFLRKGGSKSFHNGHRPHGQPDYGGNFTWSSCRRPSSPASLLGYSGGIICLQCVLQKFADTEYKSLGHIYYSELPLEMEGDSDSDSTNSEADWPSAGLDRGRALQNQHQDERTKRVIVQDWIAADRRRLYLTVRRR
ncbi:hypothetical protein B0H13DRAFT_171413 [Mycena leptocephala]|nr:hypothetical protein B0H13DRAFT_171413 [Mycena leptocephala]